MNAFTRLLSILCSIFLIPFVVGSAASQYHLDINFHGSKCFMECHTRVEYTIEIPGTGSNSGTWITKNCQQEAWKNLMSSCLPLVCDSPPDVAYAVEYGENWCKRAGVNVKLQLPESYLNSYNGSYFKSEEYLASKSSSEKDVEIKIGSILIGLLSTFGILNYIL
ncbi:uncharacterized protein L201_001129 [Kwoniella dendrophila CBS 6074]|uniref:Uncharacterized protein n=1 Tax=Kwoniella dendrophila CBS 6074 TaxID=1295534 RepID=A0AAX4JMK7_9TREE